MPPRALLLLSGALAVLLGAVPAVAQEEARPRGCTLVLEPTPTTQSVRQRLGPERYVTHVWGGMRWTCGPARMEADSAVKNDGTGRLEMIGSVDYRDSVRTLTSDTLTYYQGDDRIVAEGRVRLTRISTESTLEGPRVVFFRTRQGAVERTVAGGRPHMVLRQAGDDSAGAAPDDRPPVVVDADSAVFVGETLVRTWGDVRIQRPDRPTTGRADSATFWTEEGRAEMYGSPRVTREDFRLTGQLIRMTFAEGALRSVEAVQEGRATGEEFDLYGERIRARMVEDEVERLWAHGEGRSTAISLPYRLAADSLDFAFRAGELDTVNAVGGATAVEVGDEAPADPTAEVRLTAGEERSWLTGDTLRVAFGPAPPDSVARGPAGGGAPDREAAAAGDTAGADPEGTREIRSMRATGRARAYYLVRADSADGGEAGGTDRRGRTYQIGERITVYFEGGEASRVTSRKAIGVYLDPLPSERARDDTLPAEDERPDAVGDSVRPPPADTAGGDP